MNSAVAFDYVVEAFLTNSINPVSNTELASELQASNGLSESPAALYRATGQSASLRQADGPSLNLAQDQRPPAAMRMMLIHDQVAERTASQKR